MAKSIAHTSSDPAGRRTSPHRFRWKWGLGILLAGIVCQQLQPLIWWKIVPSGTRSAVSLMGYVLITAYSLLVWWLFFSGLRWTTRVKGTCVFLLVVMLMPHVFRIDGFTGNRIPIISFRWTPTAQQQADDYWRLHAVPSASTVDVPADIIELEPFPVTEDDWPGFRGHRRDGVISGVAIRRNWKQRPPQLLWKHPVGAGWSSFAVVSNFAITQEQRGVWECVVCYDSQTGAEVWNHKDLTRFSELSGGDGPRATPTVYENRIYSLGATGILNCLEAATGRRLWSVNVLEAGSVSNLQWGMCGAPLIYGDFVIVTPGAQVYGTDGSEATYVPSSAVAAYDRFTGRKIWSRGEAEGSYSSPHSAMFNEQPHLLVFNADGLAGYNPQSGTKLWNFSWTNTPRTNVAQPLVISDDTLLIGTGYGRGCVLLRIEHKRETWSARAVWKSTRLRLKFSNAVIRNGYVYGLDEQVLVCLRLSDGRQMWKRGRYGFGQLIRVDDLLVIQMESGEVALVEASPKKHRELGRFSAIKGNTWNDPVLCRGLLFVRNDREAACYDVGLK